MRVQAKDLANGNWLIDADANRCPLVGKCGDGAEHAAINPNRLVQILRSQISSCLIPQHWRQTGNLQRITSAIEGKRSVDSFRAEVRFECSVRILLDALQSELF